MSERIPLSLPITLDVGGSAENDLQKVKAEIEIAAIYSNSIFRLIKLACAQIAGDSEEPDDELLGDIQNACVIGVGINLSISESLVPLSSLISESGKWRRK